MPLMMLKILIGMLVGTLIGLSGLGGGVLLMPMLIFGLGVPPIIAVGSAAAFNAMTKVGAALLHTRSRTVNWRLVFALSLGSLPGTFLGVALLGHLRSLYGSGVNDILRTFIGVLLVCVPAFLLLQKPLEKLMPPRKLPDQSSLFGISAVGLASGFLVGMSSVGSGSVTMMLLLLFVRSSPATLVGTDIVHAVALTGLTGLLHLRLGTVDPALVFPLLVGSVPGSLLGVRLSRILPGEWLKRVICVVSVATGARMLWF